MRDWIGTIKRGLRKPPRVIFARLATELNSELQRVFVQRRRRMSLHKLLKELNAPDLVTLWARLASAPFPARSVSIDRDLYERTFPGASTRIFEQAELACAHRVDLLGSGIVGLGEHINWSRDFKTGHSWDRKYFRDIDYNNPERPSDVKTVWELSRLQWLIPVAQAYLLCGDERYASTVKTVLSCWIEENPYAGSVNWACTMEVALRIFTWSWFFHVFHNSPSWEDSVFRENFLRTLFLHVQFTELHIERSDINGNHYTADAAGLVFGGLFLGEGGKPRHWADEGWRILNEEITKQVFSDGVDFEASIPYHRLVAELFLLPALYRKTCGLTTEELYTQRLQAMAEFTLAYTKPDGQVPLWGDADDARSLPFGGQPLNDHRYLADLISEMAGHPGLSGSACKLGEETFWWGGAPQTQKNITGNSLSAAFPQGGFYVMRQGGDHVFVDCGPIGLAGRGGHGHNDCLSFEAVLDGVNLITDCGANVYTASYRERNLFRSTAYHNTPQIDGEEINRFIRPDYLWNMHYDAVPEVIEWKISDEIALFQGRHLGYTRLEFPVIPTRTLLVDFTHHGLYIEDDLVGAGKHAVSIPLHLSPQVEVLETSGLHAILRAEGSLFEVSWQASPEYVLEVSEARVSPSYGVVQPAIKLRWYREKSTLTPLKVCISPQASHGAFLSVLPTHLASFQKNESWPNGKR
ncbi:alginate lyase family protein [Pseudomonas sp. RIT-PI-S]|uniref:heparinase II/III family protein n=1 Tax=Pseudomonas sp. RIT-PI-S TaxID=3035295 RepID=UPI0021DAC178|nr:alginate lyase family protein [Pseudomonas sp. RIT-PI-S]